MMEDRGKTVDAYIQNSPKEAQPLLRKVRQTIQKAAPGAVESISYGMPGYTFNGKPLAYFGAFKHHLCFFATPSANVSFKKELSSYAGGKGSIQFPYGQPIPYPLIAKMVAYKVKQLGK
jgi:uncharacterized protein YdhG (YjbR/CyaY superfamily)